MSECDSVSLDSVFNLKRQRQMTPWFVSGILKCTINVAQMMHVQHMVLLYVEGKHQKGSQSEVTLHPDDNSTTWC